VYLHDYQSIQEAKDGLKRYFWFYNKERLHQDLRYRTQAEIYYLKAKNLTGLKKVI